MVFVVVTLLVERGVFFTPWEANSAVRFAPEDPQEMARCRILDKGHEREHKANEDYTMLDSIAHDIRMHAGNTQKEVDVQAPGLKGGLKSSTVSCLDMNKDSATLRARFCKIFSLKLWNGTFTQMASLHCE